MENKILISVLDFGVYQSDGKTRKKILGYIFSEKPVLEKGKFVTFKLTTPIQVLLNASKVFRKSGTKKEVFYDLLSSMAPLTVGNCIFVSIQHFISPSVFHFRLKVFIIFGQVPPQICGEFDDFWTVDINSKWLCYWCHLTRIIFWISILPSATSLQK